MQGSTCPSCGASLVPGAGFCSYCGAAIPIPSAPLPSSGGFDSPPMASAGPSMPYAPAPPPQRRRRWRLIIVVAVVLILVIGFLACAYVESPQVAVGAILIWAPDNVCGLNSNPIYYSGFNDTTSNTQTIDFGVPNYNATPCTVVGVATNTSGFSLSNVQVPLSIPGMGNASMNITITTPSSP